MLFRIVSGVLLGLFVFVSCNNKEEENNSQQPAGSGEGNYALSITSDDDMRNNGNGKVTVQLTKGGKAVTDAKDTKVNLTIVCGTNDPIKLEGLLTEEGKTVISVDLSNKPDDDIGTCKLSATTSINDETVEAKDVLLSTTDGRTADDNGQCTANCDEDETPALTFKIGEEIGTDTSLTSGTLSLHACGAATLYEVDGNDVSRATDNSVSVAETGSPIVFVLGEAGDKCVLQHTDAGKTNDWAKIAAAAAQENKAALYEGNGALTHNLIMVGVDAANTSGKLQVTLPSHNKPASSKVYASGDSGATLALQNATWNGNAFNTTVSIDTAMPYAYRVLVKVEPTGSDGATTTDTASSAQDKSWWHMYAIDHPFTLSDSGNITIGKRFTLSGTTADTKISLKVAAGHDCGLHFFSFVPISEWAWGNANNRIPLTGDALGRSVTATNPDLTLLAIDGGLKSYTGNDCRVGFNINGAVIISASTEKSNARPAISDIEVNKDSRNYLAVRLPAWNAAHGTQGATKIIAAAEGKIFSNLFADTHNVAWGTEHAFDGGFPDNNGLDIEWGAGRNIDPKLKQALVSVSVTPPTAGNATTWWYYAQGK